MPAKTPRRLAPAAPGRSSDVPLLTAALKRVLQARGLRYRDVATALGASEITVKRWLAGKGLTVAVLEELCRLVELSLAELTELATGDHDTRIRQLSLEQETALADDPPLTFLFSLLLQGWTAEEARRAAELGPAELVGYLVKLDRLRLIDLLPGNRFRLLTVRNIEWRKDGPVRLNFERHVKQDFVTMDFSDPQSLWRFEMAHLSAASRARLQEMFNELVGELRELSRHDRALPQDEKEWWGTLIASRAFDVAAERRRTEGGGIPTASAAPGPARRPSPR